MSACEFGEAQRQVTICCGEQARDSRGAKEAVCVWVGGYDFVDSRPVRLQGGDKIWRGGVEEALGNEIVRVEVAGGEGEDFKVGAGEKDVKVGELHI